MTLMRLVLLVVLSCLLQFKPVVQRAEPILPPDIQAFLALPELQPIDSNSFTFSMEHGLRGQYSVPLLRSRAILHLLGPPHRQLHHASAGLLSLRAAPGKAGGVAPSQRSRLACLCACSHCLRPGGSGSMLLKELDCCNGIGPRGRATGLAHQHEGKSIRRTRHGHQKRGLSSPSTCF